MRALFRFLATVVQLVRWFFAQLFVNTLGRFQWDPPPWLARPFSHLRRGARAFGALRHTRPGAFYSWILATGVAVAAGIGGYLWYRSLPQPVRLTVVATPPELQPLSDTMKLSKVTLTFSQSAARLEDVGKIVDKGVEMDPPLPGKWEWVSDAKLEFTPQQDWAIGKRYTVSLEKRLFPRHILLASYEASFNAPAFTAQLTRHEFYQDPTDAKKKLLSLAVTFSHPVDRKSLEGAVKIKRPSKRADGSENGPGKDQYTATITYDKFDGQAFIASEDIPLPERDVQLDVTIGPDVKAAKGSDAAATLTTSLTVPAVGSFFKIQGVQVSYVRRDESGELVPVATLSMSGRVKPQRLEEVVEAYVLPKDRPARKDDPNSTVIKDHFWSAVDVGPEILALSRKITLKIDGDQGADPLAAVSFRHNAKPGQYIYFHIKRGLEAFGGYVLADNWADVAAVPPMPTELKILHPGAVLSLQGEKKLTIVSRGVPGIRARLGRVSPERINALVSQTNGNFSSPVFQTYYFGKDDLVERFEETHALDASNPAKPQYYGLDLAPYLSRSTGAAPASGKKGLFFVDIDDWDPQAKDADKPYQGDANRRGRDQRFVLVSDLGLVVKDAVDSSHDVFVMRLHQGLPAAGVEVSILGRNGIPLAIRTTDADGRASFPSLDGFRNEELPVAWIARTADDVSFMPFGREDRRLYLGRFDIGGDTTVGKVDSLDAYVFSDRGLYRPGDTAHLSTIVKNYDFSPLPSGVPLELVITDPRGFEIEKRKFSPGLAGFDEHQFATQETSPTGAYQISLYTVKDERRVSLLGATTIKVEEFLPDRLKIDAKLSSASEAGWVKAENLSAQVTLRNLYGTAAIGHRIVGTYALVPASPRLPGYESWNFLALDAATESRDEALGEVSTDAEGHAVFPLPLAQYAAKTYRLTFTAEGFELAGGRAVVGRASTIISPRDFVVGTKPDGSLEWVRQGTERRVSLIALGPDAHPVAATGLTAVLSERRWISTLVKGEDNLFRYRSTEVSTQLSSSPLAIPVEGFQYKVPASKAGTYLYEVKSASGDVLASFTFVVAGSGALARGLERNAELQVRLAKTDIAPGEEIEMELRAPYTGAGIITIERDRVYAVKWFKADSATSIQKIALPAGIEGNAFVHVAFVRGADSRELYASPLSYGVAPITISRARRTIALELKVAEKTRPQDPLEVDIKPDRRSRLIVFGVDEGILQVAHYKTPDPLSRFLRKRALEVTTRQILDQILPEYSVALKAAAGGDGDDSLTKNLNPFRRKSVAPAVFWSGIVEVGPEGKHFSFTVPSHFNGTMRIMAVAVSDDAIGATDTRILRQGPFVLSPVAPLFAAPGDEFAASVAVANNAAGSGAQAAVQVSVAPSSGATVVGPATVTIPIDEGKEGVATFKFKASGELGEAALAFSAKKGADEVVYRETMSIRPATPFEVQIAARRIDGGTDKIAVDRSIYAPYRKLNASAALLPLGFANGLLDYLEAYPHGCSEQVVSQAFPATVIGQFPGFVWPADKTATALAHALSVLTSRQNADGAIGYWAANDTVIAFQQAYALHFLIEVRDRKLGAVDAPLARLEQYLATRVEQGDPRASIADARDLAYMAYSLARDGKLTANSLAALQDKFERNLPKTWHEDPTASFLAAALKLRRDDEGALKLQKRVTLDGDSTKDASFYYDEYLRAAELLYITAKHFPERLGDVEAKAADRLAQLVIGNHYNTLTSSWTILALEAYAKATNTPKDAKVVVTAVDKEGKKSVLPMPDGFFPVMAFEPQAKRIEFDTGEAKVPLFVAVTTAGFDLEGTREPEEKGVEVFRELTDDKGNEVSKVTVGDEVTVTLAVRGIKDERRNLAIVDLLPGGFELVFDSFAGNGRAATPSEAPPAGNDDSANPHLPEDEPQEDSEEVPQPGNLDDQGSIDWWRSVGAAYASGATDGAAPFVLDHLELREDRVILYGTAPTKVAAFRYKIRATAPGTYLVPAAYAHSMYDREVRTRGKQSKITIEPK